MEVECFDMLERSAMDVIGLSQLRVLKEKTEPYHLMKYMIISEDVWKKLKKKYRNGMNIAKRVVRIHGHI